MGTPARREDLLEQIRALPIEDREYIEAELAREYELRRSVDADERAELRQRALDALSGRNPGYTLEESVARARAVAAAARAPKP